MGLNWISYGLNLVIAISESVSSYYLRQSTINTQKHAVMYSSNRNVIEIGLYLVSPRTVMEVPGLKNCFEINLKSKKMFQVLKTF